MRTLHNSFKFEVKINEALIKFKIINNSLPHFVRNAHLCIAQMLQTFQYTINKEEYFNFNLKDSC